MTAHRTVRLPTPIAHLSRPTALGAVIGLEVHAELATAHEDVLAARPTSSATSPTPTSTRCRLGLPGLAAGAQPSRRSSWPSASAWPCTATVRPSVFARKNYFYPDMPKDFQISQYDQPIDVDGWLELPVGHARRHRAGPPRGGHRQVHPRRRRRAHPRRRPLARRLQPRRRAAARDRVAARPALRREARAVRRRAARRSSSPPASPTGRWRRARCGSTPTCRSAASADDRCGTRCEIKNLNSLRSLGRAIEYEARRQVDLLEAGERVVPGDPPLGRGRRPHPHDALEGGGRRLPLLPRARPGARSTPTPAWIDARPGRAAAAAGRSAASAPGRRRRRRRRPDDGVAIVVERGQDDQALAAIDGRRRPGPGARPRRAEPRRRGRRRALDPGRLAALVALETGGELTATQAKQVLAEMRRRPARHRRRTSPRPRASRPWTPTTLERAGRRRHRRQPRRVGASSRTGDAKARGSSPASSSARS